MPPVGPLVAGNVDAAVRAQHQFLGVLRIDPEGMEVAVDAAAARTERGVERLAAVRAVGERQARLVDRVVIGRVDDDVGEVERADLDVEG